MLINKTHGTVYAGAGITKEALGHIWADRKYTRPMLFYDGSVPIGDLNTLDFFGEIRLDCQTEPTYEALTEILFRARSIYERRKWDVIVVVGGGSALDIAKAVAVLLTNNGDPLSFRGFNKIRRPGLPVIAIPSTLSGSEATNNASFIDTQTQRKMGINGAHMFTEFAILDTQWLPADDTQVWAGTFLDALTHAYESGVCRQANHLTRYMSSQALAFLSSGDRELIQLGAYLAARALCNSGSGIAGALSYPLGVLYGVPHGIAGGIFLPDAIRFNDGPDAPLAQWVTEFLAAYSVSTNLRDYGVEDLEQLQNQVKELQAAFNQNPTPFDAEKDGWAVLKRHWKK